MKIKRFLKFWLPVILWVVVIFLFSSQPTARTSQIYWEDFFIKKTAHVVEYAFLTVLLFRAFVNSGKTKKAALTWAVLLSIVYGMTDEFHQSFTPGREPRARDVFFDTIGSCLAGIGLTKLLPIMPKKLKNLAAKLDLI